MSTFVVTQTAGVTADVTAGVTWWSGHTICLVGWLGPQVWLLKSMFLSFSWGGYKHFVYLLVFQVSSKGGG